MKKLTSLSLILALGAFTACGDDEDGDDCDTTDAGGSGSGSGSGSDGGTTVTYKQVEHLGRPGIAEALLLSNGFLAGYNATAPSFTGVDAATLGMVVGEAKTVLSAIYYGTCFLNGAAGFTAVTGLHPAGLECAAVGGALFESGGLAGTVLTAAAKTGATAYADRVFGQFESDVMRIDTAAASGYLTLCDAAAPAGKPLLCGGRLLTDDVIDITYSYLLAGANPAAPPFLVQDGVSFAGAANNPNQGHPAVAATFPYSAAPI